jgi:hypothetical protein
VGTVPFLVLLVIAVVVVVLVVRASNAPGRTGRPRLQRPRPPRRAPNAGRPIAPDDDPEFLAELERRTRRDDGTKNT